MPIDEGVNIDLQFLILEVKKQSRASASVITRPTPGKIRRIQIREDYVDNLKNTLENKSYFNIHQSDTDERKLNYFRALITIASNLERCADFFESIANEMKYVVDPEQFETYELKKYYRAINKALDLIYPAFIDSNLDLAQQICDYEQALDDLYDESFARIRKQLKLRRHVDDMLSLLSITRYLERVGDSLLNIGEAILDIHIGEKMGIQQFRHLRRGLESLGIDLASGQVVFQPIMNTRSGSRVAKLEAPDGKRIFYKEGTADKIDEEIAGLKLWESHFPGWTPSVMWHNSRANHGTLLLEYIDGTDLLDVLISSPGKLDRALTMLSRKMIQTWDGSRRNRTVKPRYISELLKRKEDIQWVHGNLFEQRDLERLLQDAKRFESTLRAPFATLVHGDFNVDNIIFQPDQKRMFYVDVHRSEYGDYVQDVAVFMVSNFRIPIFSSDIRKRLDDTNRRIYRASRRYAKKHGDLTFDARLAVGLFRSLVTSTRFMFDKGFSADMFARALMILNDVLANREKPESYKLPETFFIYGSGP